MALWILRGCFLLIAIGMGLSQTLTGGQTGDGLARWVIFAVFVLGAIGAVVLDLLIRNKRIDMISSVYFGLVVGLFLTYIVNLALTPLFGLGQGTLAGISPATLRAHVVSFAGISICYGCISLLWQTKDDFRFVIPYVEFSKDVKG